MTSKSFFARPAALAIACLSLTLATLTAHAEPSIVAGSTEAKFYVTKNGAAAYRIPLYVPPGVNGQQPELSLGYSSQSKGVGHMGFGWSLTGISSISRTSAQPQFDGYSRGLLLNHEDQLSLDGMRLICVQGTHGQPGSWYRKEIDDHTKVEAEGDSGVSGIAKFTIYHPDGSKTLLGSTSNSRLLNHVHRDRVMRWAVSWERDQYGNDIKYTYNVNHSKGQMTPQKIEYGGHNGDSSHLARVQFEYSQNTAIAHNKYHAGTLTTNDTRLSNIRVYHGNDQVRRYELAYDTPVNAPYALLKSVQEYAYNSQAYPKILFTWNEDKTADFIKQMDDTNNTHGWSYLADFNGDGYTDVLVCKATEYGLFTGENYILMNDRNGGWQRQNDPIGLPSFDHTWYPTVHRSEGSYFKKDGDWYWTEIDEGATKTHRVTDSSLVEQLEEESGCGVKVTQTGDGGLPTGDYDNPTDIRIHVMDLNSDNLADVVYWNRKTGSFTIYQNMGDGLFERHANLIDKNKIDDGNELYIGNFRGDNRMELCFYVNNDNTRFYHFTNDLGSVVRYGDDNHLISGLNDDFDRLMVGDFNGDGMHDFFIYRDRPEHSTHGQHWVAMANGFNEDFTTYSYDQLEGIGINNMKSDSQHRTIQIGDINSDGLSDIYAFHRSNGSHNVYLSKGTAVPTFRRHQNVFGTDNFERFQNVTVNDFNADGMNDVILVMHEHDGWVAGHNRVLHQGGNWRNVNRWNTFSTNLIQKPQDTSSCAYKSDIWNSFRSFRTSTDDGSTLDLNGDGSPDAIIFRPDILRRTNRAQRRVITRFENNGMVHTAEYVSAKDRNTHMDTKNRTYPFMEYRGDLQIVKRHGESDGLGGLKYFSHTYYDGFSIANGRGFRGFDRVIVLDESKNRKVDTVYSDDWVHSHKASIRTISINDRRVEQTDYSRRVIDHGSGRYESRLVYQQDRRWEYNDGALVLKRETDFEHDQYGNVTKRIERVGTHKTINRYQYSNNIPYWRLGRVTRHDRETSDSETGSIRQQATTYTLNSSNQHIVSSVYMPGQGYQELRTDYTYDDRGNMLTKAITGRIHPDNNDTQTRTTTWEYDSDNRFVKVERNSLGHEIRTEWHPLHAKPQQVTHADGTKTDYQYDVMRRPTYIKKTGEGATNIAYTSNNDPIRSLQVLTASDRLPTTIEWRDIRGRVTEKGTTGFDGRMVYTMTGYNTKGEVEWESIPYHGDEGPVTVREYERDPMDRVVKEYTPGGAIHTVEYSTAEGHAAHPEIKKTKIVRRDHYGNATTEKYNLLGQLIQVDDAKGGILQYQYDSNGNLTKVIAPGGAITEMTYDNRDRRRTLDDPNALEKSYEYNAFDELIREINGRGQITKYDYDQLGRKTAAHRPEGSNIWIYDNRWQAEGKVITTRSASGVIKDYFYNEVGARVDAISQSYNGQDINWTRYTYDSVGRLASLESPDAFKQEFAYNEHKHLKRIKSGNQVIWDCLSKDKWGKVTSEAFNGNGSESNGLSINHSIDPDTGWLLNSYTRQFDQSWEYDAEGNLMTRRIGPLAETFQYDQLHRLKRSSVGGQHVHISYDASGNILSRTDSGNYRYDHGTRPYAVSHRTLGAETYTYDYDHDGNMTWGEGIALGYTAANRITSLTKDDIRIEFILDVDGKRTGQYVYQNNVLKEKKLYIGDGYERVETFEPYKLQSKTFVRIPDGQTVAIVDTQDSERYKYLIRDHLGSIVGLINENGSLLENLSFGPWGERRNAENWLAADVVAEETDRGFTGHEHLDEMKVVHMNGRTYLPTLGRFMQLDPVVQNPKSLQNYNRYTYVMNRPLNFTDPSGFQTCSTAGHTTNTGTSAGQDARNAQFEDQGSDSDDDSESTGAETPENVTSAATSPEPPEEEEEKTFWDRIRDFIKGDGPQHDFKSPGGDVIYRNRFNPYAPPINTASGNPNTRVIGGPLINHERDAATGEVVGGGVNVLGNGVNYTTQPDGTVVEEVSVGFRALGFGASVQGSGNYGSLVVSTPVAKVKVGVITNGNMVQRSVSVTVGDKLSGSSVGYSYTESPKQYNDIWNGNQENLGP